MSENMPAGRWLTEEEVTEEVANCPVKWEGVTGIFRYEELSRPDFHSYFLAGSEVTLYGIDRDGNRIEAPD